MKTSDIESLIGKTVTIDTGQKKLENGELAWKWDFSLSDEGDFDNGKIKYHEIIYDINKSVAVLGESENEKWIEIKKADLANVPHIHSPLEFYVPLLNSYKKKSLDILEEFKKYLNEFNIKFEEGDWQSFD
jgi:hypothetical protein